MSYEATNADRGKSYWVMVRSKKDSERLKFYTGADTREEADLIAKIKSSERDANGQQFVYVVQEREGRDDA